MPRRHRNMQTFLKRRNLCLAWLGALLCLLGYISLMFFPNLYDAIVRSALALGPDTDATKTWSKTKNPIPMKIYFYNWTNPHDVYNTSIKPHFQQVGPYVFNQMKQKENVSWNDNGTVTYTFRKHFYFDEENSNGKMDDLITTIDMVALTASATIRHWHFLLKSSTSMFLSSSKIHVTKTASELTFEGYEHALLTMKSLFSDNNQNRFGWFYNRNDSVGSDGVYNIGNMHNNQFGTLQQWNFNNRTPFYEGECGDIRGSAGELFPSDRQRDSIEVFSPELCRSAQFLYEKDDSIKGINGYRYNFDPETFDNGTKIPKNKCYCTGDCMPSGVLNATTCRSTPLYLSLPHFYTADPIYANSIEGMQPSKEKHQFYITLEPKTGVIIDIAARIQVNVLLQPIEGIGIFENAPKLIIPAFWFEQTVQVSDELVTPLWFIQKMPKINQIISIVIIVIGLLLILYVIYRVLQEKRRTDNNLNKFEEPRTDKTVMEEVPLRQIN